MQFYIAILDDGFYLLYLCFQNSLSTYHLNMEIRRIKIINIAVWCFVNNFNTFYRHGVIFNSATHCNEMVKIICFQT